MARCSRCGTVVETSDPDDVPFGWSVETSGRGRALVCTRCVRDNIRSIEGKLDEAWW